MSRRSRLKQDGELLDIFQSFTDLMSNAFLIMSFFLLLIFIQTVHQNKEFKNAPPIIVDEKSGHFNFPSGSALLPAELKNYIKQSVAPSIEKTIEKQPIAFVQVIGHTDTNAITQVESNLDSLLLDAAKGKISTTVLRAGSNTDLGLMRAVVVVQELKKIEKLKDVSFRAYSAGQLYLPDGQKSADDAARRRIEIRFIPPGKNS